MKASDVPTNRLMMVRKRPIAVYARRTTIPERIVTLEGTLTATPGDIIITGVEGETYPIKPDIFEKTYEPIESGD